MIRPMYQEGQGPVRWYRGKIQRIEQGQEEILNEAVELGAEMMRDMISTRGTAKSGKQGRIDTGRMLKAVKVRPPKKDSGGKTQAFFGWLEDRADYFRYQEGGFTHFRTGQDVEGMYAQLDSAEEAFRWLKEETKRNIKNA